jgi:hypothetical protein
MKSFQFFTILSLSFVFLFLSCGRSIDDSTAYDDADCKTSFNLVENATSGLDFQNTLVENYEVNMISYPYIYTGGGVAVGDLDGDQLPDLVFCGAMVPTKIYKNLGDLKFKDITVGSGIKDLGSWSTGVTLLDINDDYLLDIYVSKSGPKPDGGRNNELYINQGNMKFVESAAAYGLNDDGYSNQLYAWDMDNDGQQEFYLINHPMDFSNNSKVRSFQNGDYASAVKDRVFKLKGSKYEDVSASIGITNRAYGLSVASGDMDQDGYTDLYVCNDYLEPDLYYQNEAGGSMVYRTSETFNHITFNSMGSEAVDMNNDGLLDLITLDMLPQSHFMSKTSMRSMDVEQFYLMNRYGYHYQYMSNALHLNQGNGAYSEVGQLAGISKTDWSWAVLCPDLDNDGWKDIFVTNGIKRAITDNDGKNLVISRFKEGKPMTIEEAIDAFPAYKESNVFFRNEGNGYFSNAVKPCGLDIPVNSNGAAYADLDLDGDMDIITNNFDTLALIYENNASNNFLRINLKGKKGNTLAQGTKVLVKSNMGDQYFQHFIGRGFLSSVDPVIVVGLGQDQLIDSLIVSFPTGELAIMTDVAINQTLTIDQAQYPKGFYNFKKETAAIGNDAEQLGMVYTHKENVFKDFEKEVLLPHKLSQQGPITSVGDVNGDGLEDMFIGGARGAPGELWIQETSGKLAKSNQPAMDGDLLYEDVGSVFFDVDNDGDPDLYVVSGGVEQPDPSLYVDRLYLNNGKGLFSKSAYGASTSGSKVIAVDYDQDGFKDLVVAGKVVPGKYPYHEKTSIFKNIQGQLKDVSAEACPDCGDLGIINDVKAEDMNGDGAVDLILAGEWTGIIVLEQKNGQFINRSDAYGTNNMKGWWASIELTDIDKDGDLDIIAGNIGENNKFQPSEEKPFYCYSNDMDNSGTIDIVLSKFSKTDGRYVPVRGKECSSQQMPFIAEKFESYESFAEADLITLYGEELEKGLSLEANNFSSMVLINDGGKFTGTKLPVIAQYSEVNSILPIDIDKDGTMEYILAGNKYGAEVETVRYDASYGVILSWDKTTNEFVDHQPKETGLYLGGNVKSLSTIKVGSSTFLVVGKNQGQLSLHDLSKVKLPNKDVEI